MKKSILIIVTCLLSFHLLPAMAFNPVRLIISDGISNQQLKAKMEQAVSVMMTEINRSQEQNLSKLSFPETYVSKEAQEELNKLWSNEHFRCVEEEIVERCLTSYSGYQVRGISLIVNAVTKGKEQAYQEAVVNFDKDGTIVSFYYTINPELYSKLVMDSLQDKRREVADIEERMMILDYVEHFRTAYNQKDMRFLQQVFSDEALIIVGKVIKVRKTEVLPSGNRVVYTTLSKKQYLENLGQAFKANTYIKVNFDDILIVKHPTIRGIFGVTVHQQWNTARYSDEGYVFMVWDFRHPDEPQIHVRTWQPDYIDKLSGRKLNPNEVFSLGDFDL